MMKVGVVMPTINLWAKYTRPALESVFEAMQFAAERSIYCDVILVDNGSTDETKEEAPKLFTQHFNAEVAAQSYQRNEDRWGFQRSVNFGVNKLFADGHDFVLVLNNDVVMHPESIARLVERFSKGGVGMATCMDVRGECHANAVVLKKMRAAEKETCPEAPHPNFSAFMVDRACWETVGEFDELYFPAYFEDNDFHYRMGLAGIASVVYPPAMFLHYGSRTQNEALGAPLVSGPQFENNRALFTAKWGGAPGSEQFKTPYGRDDLSIKSVKQNTQ